MRRTACVPLVMLAACSLAAAGPALAQAGCEDAFRTEVVGDAITIHHLGATYNCCPEPFAYEVSQEGDRIVVQENEILENPCYCLCCYDLEATVSGAAPGAWNVVFRWYDYETWLWREVVLPVVVPAPGSGGPLLLTGASDSGCLGISAVPPEDPATRTWGAVKGLYR